MEKLMVTEFILGLMETDIKDNLNNASNMVKVLINLEMVICIVVIIKMENLTDMASIFGQMVVLTKDNFLTDWEMEKESGESQIN